MRRFTCFFIALIAAVSLFAQRQPPNLDSLRTVFTNAELSTEQRLEAGDLLFRMLFRKDRFEARKLGFEILSLSKREADTGWIATSYKLIGNSYAAQGDFDSAMVHFKQCHSFAKAAGDRLTESVVLSNMGNVYYETGNYSRALKLLFEGLRMSEELEDSVGISRVTNNIGNVFTRQDEHEKALEYYTYSLRIKEVKGNPWTLSTTHNNLGLANTNLGNGEQAIYHLEKSIEYAEEVGHQVSKTRALNNIGTEYMRQGRYQEALDIFMQSLAIKESLDDQEGIGHTYATIGICYNKMGESRKAVEYCQQGLEFGREISALKMVEQSCHCLAEAYEDLGNDKQALKYFREFTAAKDSLFNREITEEITRTEMLYDFDKQQLADSVAFEMAQAEQELQHQLDMDRQRSKLNIIVFGGLGLLIIGVIYYRSRQKGKELAQERIVIEKMKQVDQLKDQFLANTSHELRTPLNGIIGLSESMKDGADGALPERALADLDMISSSGQRLLHLVNDILDFSKLKNGELALNKQPVDIHTLADVVLNLCEPLVVGKDVRLVNAVPKDLPLVDADENRLQQVFYNLIGNAIKFTEKGQVEVSAAAESDDMLISIKDTGVGIAKEDLGTVFRSFEQLDGTAARSNEGTGLGLSITKQLVELHGGWVKVASVPGAGSNFKFSLPISEETSVPEKSAGSAFRIGGAVRQPEEDTVTQEIPVRQFSDLRVLVVDDEPVNRRVLNNHLSVAGYQVVEATGGQEALDYILNPEEHFNIVLLDVMMPAMSGYEVCRKVRDIYLASELPIVLLTAKDRVIDVVEGFDVGANDYLTKPFSKDELLSRIKTHINLSTIHRASTKFVPIEFIRSVGRESINEVNLGDHIEKEVTVVFSDIREYTKLAESMTPTQNFKFVNSYVGKMGPLIQRNEGFVNQYLGDGIMALFPKKPADALQSAIDMQRRLRAYNEHRSKKGYKPLQVGIGLHTGTMVLGIIGDQRRNDTAIIADAVNTASRMEGLTKHYGANIILSQESYDRIENKSRFNIRHLGQVKVVGKEKTLGIYECFDGDCEDCMVIKRETAAQFKQGVEQFSKGDFREASKVLSEIYNINPQDKVAEYFIEQCKAYSAEGIPGDQVHANTMTKK